MASPHPRPVQGRARLVETVWHTPDTLELAFEPETPVLWLPGQYVSIHLPEVEGQRKKAVRAYSIWSHPTEGPLLRTVVKLIPGGRASEWFRTMPIGQDLEWVAPLGMFLLREPLPRHLVFIGTGTGIVPLRSMLRELEVAGRLDQHDVQFWMGVRSEADIFAREELEALAATHPRLSFELTLSRPAADWPGRRGRLTAFFQPGDELPPVGETQFYLCGNGAMIKEIKSLLRDRGHDRRAVITEKYFD